MWVLYYLQRINNDYESDGFYPPTLIGIYADEEALKRDMELLKDVHSNFEYKWWKVKVRQ